MTREFPVVPGVNVVESEEYAWALNGKIVPSPLGTPDMMRKMKKAGHYIYVRKRYRLVIDPSPTDGWDYFEGKP